MNPAANAAISIVLREGSMRLSMKVDLTEAVAVSPNPGGPPARFAMHVARTMRLAGIRLCVRHDFSALVDLNARERARPGSNWHGVAPMFDPATTDLSPETSFWISGDDRAGDTVFCIAGRSYDWRGSSLADEVRTMFLGGRDIGQGCVMTPAAAAKAARVTGTVFYEGVSWIRPDYRGRGLMPMRLARAYAMARWSPDWSFALILQHHIDRGLRAIAGYTDTTFGISFSRCPPHDRDFWLIRMSNAELLADLSRQLAPAAVGAAAEESPRYYGDRALPGDPGNDKAGKASHRQFSPPDQRKSTKHPVIVT